MRPHPVPKNGKTGISGTTGSAPAASDGRLTSVRAVQVANAKLDFPEMIGSARGASGEIERVRSDLTRNNEPTTEIE